MVLVDSMCLHQPCVHVKFSRRLSSAFQGGGDFGIGAAVHGLEHKHDERNGLLRTHLPWVKKGEDNVFNIYNPEKSSRGQRKRKVQHSTTITTTLPRPPDDPLMTPCFPQAPGPLAAPPLAAPQAGGDFGIGAPPVGS